MKCDLPFALRSTAIGRRAYLCEYDRGTMPILRPHFNQTSILRKFAGYIAGHNQKLHEIQFGWKAYRVLFIATSKKRAANMREALAEYTTQPNDRARFYFTSADEIAKRRHPVPAVGRRQRHRANPDLNKSSSLHQQMSAGHNAA